MRWDEDAKDQIFEPISINCSIASIICRGEGVAFEDKVLILRTRKKSLRDTWISAKLFLFALSVMSVSCVIHQTTVSQAL